MGNNVEGMGSSGNDEEVWSCSGGGGVEASSSYCGGRSVRAAEEEEKALPPVAVSFSMPTAVCGGVEAMMVVCPLALPPPAPLLLLLDRLPPRLLRLPSSFPLHQLGLRLGEGGGRGGHWLP